MLKYRSNLKDEEVLIICNDRDLIEKIIKSIYKDFIFISILENLGQGDIICQNLLEELGLSIFQQKGNRNIKKYGIIINMEKDRYIDITGIKKEAIVFDFSRSDNFRSIKSSFLIEDITIKATKEFEKSELFPKKVLASLYEKLSSNRVEEFYSIYSRGNFYLLDEIMNSDNKLKGSI